MILPLIHLASAAASVLSLMTHFRARVNWSKLILSKALNWCLTCRPSCHNASTSTVVYSVSSQQVPSLPFLSLKRREWKSVMCVAKGLFPFTFYFRRPVTAAWMSRLAARRWPQRRTRQPAGRKRNWLKTRATRIRSKEDTKESAWTGRRTRQERQREGEEREL